MSWFSWFRKSRPLELPALSAANPGKVVRGTFRLDRGERTENEAIDLAAVLARALRAAEVRHLEHPAGAILPSGIILQPRLAGIDLPREGRVHTTSTIEVALPANAGSGSFEYLHGNAATVSEALDSSFAGWVRFDLPVWLDAVEPQPRICTAIETGGEAKVPVRRVLLGPSAHAVSRPANAAVPENHPYCPCCMFTHLRELLWPLVQAEGTTGIRFYAARNEVGDAVADCRINGVDFPEGIAALRDYVNTWPDRGVESRKQFILIQTKPS